MEWRVWCLLLFLSAESSVVSRQQHYLPRISGFGHIASTNLIRSQHRLSARNSLSRPLFLPHQALPEDKRLVKKTLPNGLQYYLLPSKKLESFAAYLEILTGSSDESENQRGMAHLVEHLVCNRIPDAKSNAFADFHHSVFYHFDCQPSSLPAVLDSFSSVLSDPLSAPDTPERVKAEKFHCLSEMALIDTVRSRIDFQIFSALHSENLLPHRAPIGERDQIESWTSSDLKDFYRSHYHPLNTKLYLSGNFDPTFAEYLIAKKLGTLSSSRSSSPSSPSSPSSLLSPSPLSPRGPTLKSLNRHFPPVIHRWTGAGKEIASDLKMQLSKEGHRPEEVREMVSSLSQTSSLPTVKVIPTPAKNEVTISLFSKKPLLPLSSLSDLQRDLTQRVLHRILQTRLHHLRQSRNPLFGAEFSAHRSVKEGCIVLDLSIKTHADHWRRSLKDVVQEVRRLLEHGVLNSEWQQCKRSLLGFYLQEANDCATNPERACQSLMDSVAQQRTVLGEEDLRGLLQNHLLGPSLPIELASSLISETFAFLSRPSTSAEPQSPASLVALVPQASGWSLSPAELQQEFLAILSDSSPTDPPKEILPPASLLSPSPLTACAPAVLAESTASLSWGPLRVPTQRLTLAEGVNLTLADSRGLSDQRTAIRFSLPLTLGANHNHNFSSASAVLAVAVRTMAQGGAMGRFSRSEVEQWCLDRNLAVEISASAAEPLREGGEGPQLVVNLVGMTPLVSQQELSSLFEMVSLLLQEFQTEEDAFLTARARLIEERAWKDSDLQSTARDEIFRRLSPASTSSAVLSCDLEKVSFTEVQSALSATLSRSPLKISVVAPFPLSTLRSLSSNSLRLQRQQPPPLPPPRAPLLPLSPPLDPELPLQLSLSSDKAVNQSIAILAGLLPASVLRLECPQQSIPVSVPALLLTVAQELINQRLFETVRERDHLAYEATLSCHLPEGLFLVSVPCLSRDTALATVVACRETLRSLSLPGTALSPAELQAGILRIKQRLLEQAQSPQFWLDSVHEQIPLSAWFSLEETLRSITPEAVSFVQEMVRDENLATFIASCPPSPTVEE